MCILYEKKSYFLKLISPNAFWTFILYYMYFSYGKVNAGRVAEFDRFMWVGSQVEDN